jgi:purine catabolism regulator
MNLKLEQYLQNSCERDAAMHRAAIEAGRNVTVRRTLLDLVLQNRGLDAVLGALAGLIGLPGVLLDDEGRLLAGSDENVRLQAGDLMAQLEREQALRPGRRAVRLESELDGRPCCWLVHPVQIGTETVGYICLLEDKSALQQADIAIVEEATVAVALEFQKRLAADEIERRYLNDFIRDLLEGRIESEANAIHRGIIYRWDVTKPQVIFAVRLLTSEGCSISHPSIEGKMQYLKRIEKAIQRAMAVRPGGNYLIAHFGDVNVMLLVPSSNLPTVAKQEAVKLAKLLLPQLQTVLDNQTLTVKIGISRVCCDIFSLPDALREALEAIQMSVALESADLITHYDDLGVSRLLMRIEDTTELERFRDEYLGKLLSYDADHGANLLETLRAWVDTHGQLKETARKLFIHYNTLRYRLNKIKEITGFEFKSWREIAQIMLAIEVHHILQIRKDGAAQWMHRSLLSDAKKNDG